MPIIIDIRITGTIEIISYWNACYLCSWYEKSVDNEKRVRWLEQQTVLPYSSYIIDPLLEILHSSLTH